MKLILRILFLLFLYFPSFSQTLEGKVSSNGQAVPFATISLKGSPMGTSANADGYYRLDNIIEGTYEVVVSVLGYRKFREELTISPGLNRFDASLIPSSVQLEQVIVTASMKESFLHASPVKVEVLTQKFLQKVASANVMEVIDNINGVQNQINCVVCGTNDIHINGMEGPYTLVLIDGMPIMSSLSTVYGLNGIPTSLIKQIEVIKGPSSTLYGSEAVAGVINIITKKANDAPLVELASFFTSHLEKNMDFSFAPKLAKSDVLLSGNLFQMQNFIDSNNDNFSDVPLSKRLSLFNRWSINRKSNKKLHFSAKYFQENRFGGVEEWNKEYRGSDSIYGESIYTDRFEFVGSYQFPTEENIRLDASFNYHHQDSYYGNTKYKAWQEVYFANLIWDKSLGKKHQLLLGYTHRYESYLDSTLVNIHEQKFIPGFFVQDEINLSTDWTMMGGMRLDHHQDHDFIFAPRFSLKWQAEPYTIFRLNAGTGFRTVNLFTEDHAALTGAREVIIKEKLEPEESYNVNVNMNHIYSLGNSSGTIDFDVFYTHFSNKILPDYESNDNQIIYANLEGTSISRGIAFTIQQNFEFPLSISIGTTFLDVHSIDELNQKEKELFAPRFSSVFSASYQLSSWDASLEWSARIIGPMKLPTYSPPFNRAETSPWFSQQHFQFNKKINVRFASFFAVKNVFNYMQETPLIDPENPFGENFDTAYAYGPLQGRRLVIGLRYTL